MIISEPRKNNHKVTTIAELRQAAKERAAAQRYHDGFQAWQEAEAQRRAAIAQEQAAKQKAIDFERLQHCETILKMLQKIAICYHIPCLVDTNAIYRMMAKYNWTCPTTGIAHSDNTPLSIEFNIALARGGKLVPTNLKPKFYEAQLAGAFIIERQDSEPTPPTKRVWTGISYLDAYRVRMILDKLAVGA